MILLFCSNLYNDIFTHLFFLKMGRVKKTSLMFFIKKILYLRCWYSKIHVSSLGNNLRRSHMAWELKESFDMRIARACYDGKSDMMARVSKWKMSKTKHNLKSWEKTLTLTLNEGNMYKHMLKLQNINPNLNLLMTSFGYQKGMNPDSLVDTYPSWP